MLTELPRLAIVEAVRYRASRCSRTWARRRPLRPPPRPARRLRRERGGRARVGEVQPLPKAVLRVEIRRLASCAGGEGALVVAEVALVRRNSLPGTGSHPPRAGAAARLRPLAAPWERAGGAARRPARDRRGHAARAACLAHAPDEARIRIGAGTFLNIGVMVASAELVEIGDHCMFANGASSRMRTIASTTPTGRSPGRASRARGRPESATTSGAARTWWSRAA